MEKRCGKCKEVKDVKEFHKDKYTKTGYKSTCRKCEKDRVNKKIIKSIKYRSQKNYKQITEKKCNTCGKVRDIKYFNTRTVNEDGFETKCKICIDKYNKKNFEHISLRHKKYNKKNKEQISLQQMDYKEKNKKQIRIYNVKRKNSNAKYETYAEKLTVDESPRLHKDGKSIEVLCRYCGKYFIPTNHTIDHRVSALNGHAPGDCYLYCSDECKDNCPTYGRIKYPKGFKKGTSREVSTYLRQLCFERDNWECQKCGTTENLHCHHINGYTQNKILVNDIENVITLCKSCHKEVHSEVGCRYVDLKCQ